MISNTVLHTLRRGEATFGTWVALGNSLAAQILADVGFDWLVIDSEHGSIDIETVARITEAVGRTGCIPMVRVPWNDPGSIKRALDAGAYGIVVPMVNSQKEALQAVESSRYPPRGIRSYGGPRARLYGGVDYLNNANQEIAVILQIEHVNAVERIDEILDVEGLDAFFVGPSDLAISLGLKPGNLSEPKLVDAIREIVAAGKKRGVPGGILVPTAEAANEYMAQGFQLIGVGSDEGFLRSAARVARDRVPVNRKPA